MNVVAVGAILGFLAVALGAFGAHALKRKLSDEMLTVYQTGVTYQMYHALALIGLGILVRIGVGCALMTVAGWLFVVGILLFSGSLYLLSLSGQRKLGAITPIGGLCFLAGWVLVFVGVL